MPTLSVYAVSVIVGGRGSAIIDCQKHMYISKCSSENYLLILKIKPSVLIKQGVLISEASFKRGSTVYVAAQGRNYLLRIFTVLPCSKRCSAELPLRAGFIHTG